MRRGSSTISLSTRRLETSIFQELNPEAVTGTAFKRGLHRAGGGANLMERPNATADDKARAINVLLQSTRRKSQGYDDFSSSESASRRSRRRSEPQPQMMMMNPVVPLANPRGVKTTCEMCSQPGRMSCAMCHVTYYCSNRHRHQDSSHLSICPRLRVIRGNLGLSSDRTKRCQGLAQKNLVTASLLDQIFSNAMEDFYMAKYDSAVAEFQTCLTLISDVYGLQSCEAITLFIYMCDTFILQNALEKALQSLAMATYELRLLEEDDEGASLDYTRALLFKSQGKIDMAHEQYQDATLHFAECVYYSAEAFGGEHVRACAGYFYLGMALVASNKNEKGHSMLGFCADLWTAYLEGVFMSNVPDDDVDQLKAVFDDRVKNVIPPFFELDAQWQLTGIQEELRIAEVPSAVVKSTVCLGIIHFFNTRYSLSKKYAESVLDCIDEIKDPALKHLAKRLARHSTRRGLQTGCAV